MHSNAFLMLSKKAATMPLGTGASPVLCSRFASLGARRSNPVNQKINLIHLIINQTHSL